MCQSAFNKLKVALVSNPILKLLDFSRPFEVIIDASGFAIGGVLMQEGHAVAYESRKLRTHERTMPSMTWNCLLESSMPLSYGDITFWDKCLPW